MRRVTPRRRGNGPLNPPRLLLAAGIAAAVGTLGLLAVGTLPMLLGYDVFVVKGGSMAPAIRAGSVVVAERVDPHTVEIGDIITFRRPQRPDHPVTHRVVAVRLEDGVPAFQTMGDANGSPDPEEVSAALPISRLVYTVPFTGYVLAFGRSHLGKALLVGLPLLLLLAWPADGPSWRRRRPRISRSPPRGLSAEEVRRLLAATPETPSGLRDRAIILTLVLTGRRRAEVLDLTAGDIEPGEPPMYRYRAKGGKRGRRELPGPAHDAIVRALAAFGKDLDQMEEAESLWPSTAPARAHGRGVTSGTVYGNFRRYLTKAGLPPAGIHILRHTAAKLRREAGEQIEAVSTFLDHSSLGVTTTYLRRLEGQADGAGPGWRR